MCIAICKPEGKIIAKENLMQSFSANPDGAGFMVSENKRLVIKKGFFNFEDFWEAFEPYQEKQAVIHFRIKTHGKIDVTNCHPFRVNQHLGFIHNGVISGYGDNVHNDTIDFNEKIMKPLAYKYGREILFTPEIKSLIETKIGYSKFVFMDHLGNFNIFNENKGLWDNGVWYSNSSYKIPEPYKHSAPAPVPYPIYNKYDYRKKSQTISVNDEVFILTHYVDEGSKKCYKRGTLFEVVAVNNNFTCDLMGYEEDSFLYNVPFSRLEIFNDMYHDFDQDGRVELDTFFNKTKELNYGSPY